MRKARRKSIFTTLGLPAGFGSVLLNFGLILAVGPCVPGSDFGVFKVPAFSPEVMSVLRTVGPIALLLIVALFVPWRAPKAVPEAPETAANALSQGSGGKGGDAKVGGQGVAIGGPGGHGGKHGQGGDGGSAATEGDGIAVGGAGGSAGDDGIWRPPAKSGYEIYQRKMGLPVDPTLRGYGRGGASSSYVAKLKVIEELRETYFRENDKAPEGVFENIKAVPLRYLNDKIVENGEPWRVRIIDDEYEFFIP